MSLKNKIVIVVAIMVIVIASTGFISSYLKMSNSESRYDELAVHGNQQLWDLITLKQYNMMESGIKSVTRDRKLKKALAKNDLTTVSENARTAFNLLEGQHVLSSLQITDVKAKIVFDAPNASAQNTINPIAKIALKTQKITRSISRNQQGKLQSELVFPITNRGKVGGTGSYSLDLSVAIKQLKERQGSQVYISSEQGELLSSSDIDLGSELSQLNLPLQNAKHLLIKKDNKVYSTTILPIVDVSNTLLANIIMILDNTESYKSQESINISAAILLVLISLFMLIFIYWYLNKSLKPLHAISQSLRSVSEGDLTVSIEQNKQKDEISEIQGAISNTIIKLHELLSKVTPLVAEVNRSSDALNGAMLKNQNNIDQQKNNIGQVTIAAKGVGSAVANISQSSDEMSTNSKDADEELKKGSVIIHQTITSINTIASQVEESSRVINELFSETETIGSVLDVIKVIAEQTNLLALNAAIEAARAGEAGRGFAVVADEVRTLAGKTQESTEEIEKMIERLRSSASAAVAEMQSSNKEVGECVELSNKTGQSLEIITPKVGEIKDKNIEINDAIDEQKKAIEDINHNIANIHQVAENSVKQNAEALSISENLKELSTSLEHLIEQFRV